MIRVIMHGCNGQMGSVITEIISSSSDMEIVAGVDVNSNNTKEYPVFDDIFNCNIEADVIIDFASAKAVDSLIEYALDKKMPIVLCTTGLSDKQIDKITEASREIAILKSANMSLGINTLVKILKIATDILAKARRSKWNGITFSRFY